MSNLRPGGAPGPDPVKSRQMRLRQNTTDLGAPGPVPVKSSPYIPQGPPARPSNPRAHYVISPRLRVISHRTHTHPYVLHDRTAVATRRRRGADTLTFSKLRLARPLPRRAPCGVSVEPVRQIHARLGARPPPGPSKRPRRGAPGPDLVKSRQIRQIRSGSGPPTPRLCTVQTRSA